MSSLVPRREFLARSLAGGAVGVVGISAVSRLAEAAPPADAKRQVYELWLYQMTDGGMVQKADDYFQHALIPALRRAGAGPVGVFVESSKADAPVIYVLIPHAGMDSAAALSTTLRIDADYQKAGAAFLSASPKDPAYVNHEARLMRAARFMPALEAPMQKESRVFELRRYRSPSEAAFRKKLEMFETRELAIFRRVGLNPVFFGEMLFGPDMFNITYMLTYPDAAARGKAWGEFGKDPDWQKLRVTSGYTDAEIIANIKSLTLKPAPYSQI
ncbi:MAG TPA: NIPSNAP family protein [Pirellulales bacterium]|jgi:hypothetical protein|nr:NIPSNAP family protein [Pirellulales bacterium]